MPKKEKQHKRLPNKIIPIPCADKERNETWNKSRGMLNFPCPTRFLIAGPPNSGKSTVCKNILLRANPPYERVMVVHCDPEYTQEYDDVGAEMLGEIPDPQEFEGDCKTMVILDDMEFKSMNKTQRRCLDRLVGFVSTHKYCSVAICVQDLYQLPPICRRCSNCYIFYKQGDIDALVSTARKTGFKRDDFKELFDLCKTTKDSIWIDKTDNTPYPLRFNGFELIERE